MKQTERGTWSGCNSDGRWRRRSISIIIIIMINKLAPDFAAYKACMTLFLA